MASTLTTEELRKMNRSELDGKAVELRGKIHDLRLQKVIGGEMNTALIGKSRRELARVLTIMAEQAVGGAQPVSSEAKKKASKETSAPKTQKKRKTK